MGDIPWGTHVCQFYQTKEDLVDILVPYILTARDISGNKERALNAGAQAFLQKPVDNDVLLETIRKVLGNNNGQIEEEQSAVKYGNSFQAIFR